MEHIEQIELQNGGEGGGTDTPTNNNIGSGNSTATAAGDCRNPSNPMGISASGLEQHLSKVDIFYVFYLTFTPIIYNQMFLTIIMQFF